MIKLAIAVILAPFSWFWFWLFGAGVFLLFCWTLGVVVTAFD